MKLGYIILAHEPFKSIEPLLSTLVEAGDIVALHYDSSSSHFDDIEKVKTQFPSVMIVPQVAVEWGEASIVEATFNGIATIQESNEQPDYITLLSGSCFPIASSDEIKRHLHENNGKEFIECHDISQGQWVKDGLESQRWEFYHFFNWRKNPKLFSLSEKIQRKLRIKRKFPVADNTMYMGSQWWTLSYETCGQILDIYKRFNIQKYINRTWIPDEFLIQTLVGNIKEKYQILPPLMNYKFNRCGIPKVYTSEDISELCSLSNRNKFFTRKVSLKYSCFLEDLKRMYLLSEKSYIKKEVSDLAWSKLSDNHFRYWFTSCPLPIVIFISEDNINSVMINLKDFMADKYIGFSIYGELLKFDQIDSNGSPLPEIYENNNVYLRDYEWHEFFYSIAKINRNGFSFSYRSYYLNSFIDHLKNLPNVLFVDCLNASECDLEVLRKSQKLERYLHGYECKYFRVTDYKDISMISNRVTEHIADNLYLEALSRRA